jgi:hypothetical protein
MPTASHGRPPNHSTEMDSRQLADICERREPKVDGRSRQPLRGAPEADQSGAHTGAERRQQAPNADPSQRERMPERNRAEDRALKPLPPIVSMEDFLQEEMPLPPIMIEDLMGEQEKHLTSGGSKSCKTWLMLDEAISVAAGVPFLGLETRQTRVLFCNFEIPPAFFQQRVRAICEAKGVKESQVRENLDLWNLRGHSRTIDLIIPLMLERMRGRKPYGLLTLDPVYKLMGDRSENDATAVGDFFGHLEHFINDTGAAISMSHHHSKGNQAGKSSLDRNSGSGVWSRDPDAIRDLTPHAEEGSFTYSTTLRLRPRLDRFVVTWKFPLFQLNPHLDPEALKAPGAKTATTTAHDIADVLASKGPLTATQWQKVCADSGICASSRFYELKKQAVAKGLVRERPQSHKRSTLFEAV